MIAITRRFLALSLALLVLPMAPALAAPGAAPPDVLPDAVRCRDKADDVHRLDVTIQDEATWGLYAAPAERPNALVVFFHGYGHTPESWRTHLARVAQQDGVLAVAMNYRGSIEQPSVRGWRVREGAEDLIAVAQLLNRRCGGFDTIVAYGVSMGGNASGLALAAKAERAPGVPLFDRWFDIEGATNVLETYWEARAVAVSGNEFAVQARQDIEQEMGGPFEDRADVYADHTVVRRVDDVAASGVKGVVIVHGVGDGLVPYDQSREMASALRANGVPVHFFTVVTRSEGSEDGTTLDGYLDVNENEQHTSPFAGHASEASTNHDVGNLGFDRLHALLNRELRDRELPECDREHVVDGATMVFAPKASGC